MSEDIPALEEVTEAQAKAAAYIRLVGLTIASIIGFVLFLCISVDPYGIFGVPVWPGLTADKPAAADRARFSKPYRVDQSGPATLLIGSSALNIGIDPESPSWPSADRPVYNLGIDGASIEVQKRFLMHALAKSHPKRVIFFVSFEDMITSPANQNHTGETYDFERRMRVLDDGRPNPSYPFARFQDFIFATLSEQSVVDSIKTLLHQHDSTLNNQTASGFERRNRLENWTVGDGTSALLKTSFDMRVENYKTSAEPVMYRMDTFAAMITAARNDGAEILIVVQPVYVAGLDLRRQAGMTKQSLMWLTDLTRTAERVASITGGLQHVTTWDFSGFSPYNQEPLPKQGDRNYRLRWFYEAIHFRPNLGDLMVERMMSNGGPADLGQRLTTADLARVEELFTSAQRKWVSEHPDEVEQIRALMKASEDTICRRDKVGCDSQLSAR